MAGPRQNIHWIRLFTLCVLIAGLVGCASKPIPLDPAFRQSRHAKVAVVTMEAPKATLMQEGSQGLLDAAISLAITTGTRHRLEDYPSQVSLDTVGARFVQRLNSLGYKAKLIGTHPSTNDFNPHRYKPTDDEPIPGRDSYLKGFDAVLFVDMSAVGEFQLVYGFIPLSGCRATATLSGVLLANPDGKCLWRSKYFGPADLKAKNIEGSNSDTANVYRAIDQAVDAQGQALEQDFFAGF